MGKQESKPEQVPAQSIEPMNIEQAHIIEYLKKVRFKKKLFGGVSELDVWKKLEELDKMYASALMAERVRYDALLQKAAAEAAAKPPEGSGG